MNMNMNMYLRDHTWVAWTNTGVTDLQTVPWPVHPVLRRAPAGHRAKLPRAGRYDSTCQKSHGHTQGYTVPIHAKLECLLGTEKAQTLQVCVGQPDVLLLCDIMGPPTSGTFVSVAESCNIIQTNFHIAKWTYAEHLCVSVMFYQNCQILQSLILPKTHTKSQRIFSAKTKLN